jgi:hypothetical protein
MARVPAVLFFIEAQEREVDDPQEVETVSGDFQLALRFENISAVEANFAEDFAGIKPLVGREKDEVAFLDGEFFDEGGLFQVSLKNFTMGDFHSPFSTLI